jgi:hypothetical protein
MKFFVNLWKSVTSFRFYKEIAFQRVSKSIGYFFLFIFLITLILSMKFSNALIQGMEELSKELGDRLPEIRIENGVVSTDAQEPFIIEEKDFIFVIDTTGKITTIDPSYKQGILLTKDKLVTKKSAIETKEYNLSKIKSFTVNKEAMERWRKTSSRFAFPFLVVILFPYYIVTKLIQILFFSLIALIANTATKANLKYENLFNISLFALTPPVLLATIFILTGLRIPFSLSLFLYTVIYIIFLIGGIRSCKEV